MPVKGLTMPNKKRVRLTPKQEEKVHIALIKQMLSLATAGFGLVAALAWNDTIKTLIEDITKRFLPGTGLKWQFIYAIAVTALAVFVTYYLTRLVARFERKPEEKESA